VARLSHGSALVADASCAMATQQCTSCPIEKSITVIFITARSHPFSPLFQHGTDGHADL
jgi:hypothetical protein